MTCEEALRGFYQCAVGVWGIQPSEFWEMPLWEFWWLYDAKRTAAGGTAPLTNEDLAEQDNFAAEYDAKARKRNRDG